MEAANIAEGICRFTSLLQSVFISKVRTRQEPYFSQMKQNSAHLVIICKYDDLHRVTLI